MEKKGTLSTYIKPSRPEPKNVVHEVTRFTNLREGGEGRYLKLVIRIEERIRTCSFERSSLVILGLFQFFIGFFTYTKVDLREV